MRVCVCVCVCGEEMWVCLADERQPMHVIEGGLACCHGNSAAYQNVLDIY